MGNQCKNENSIYKGHICLICVFVLQGTSFVILQSKCACFYSKYDVITEVCFQFVLGFLMAFVTQII